MVLFAPARVESRILNKITLPSSSSFPLVTPWDSKSHHVLVNTFPIKSNLVNPNAIWWLLIFQFPSFSLLRFKSVKHKFGRMEMSVKRDSASEYNCGRKQSWIWCPENLIRSIRTDRITGDWLSNRLVQRC